MTVCDIANDRIYLECECGWESVGWELNKKDNVSHMVAKGMLL